MDKTLDEIKEALSDKYLGQAGIHGIGLSRTENAIRVYLQESPDEEQQRVLKGVETDASPYKIIVVPSVRPSLT